MTRWLKYLLSVLWLLSPVQLVMATTASPFITHEYNQSVLLYDATPVQGVPRNVLTDSATAQHSVPSFYPVVGLVAAESAVQKAVAPGAAKSVKPSRGFGELVDDFDQNPGNWNRVSAHTEKATRKGARNAGASVQEIYENTQTGERMVRHTVIDDAGKVVDDHFRPNYKPRAGDLYDGN